MDDNPAVIPAAADDGATADAYIARNREALNASIARSREEFSQGRASPRTVDDIIEAGHTRNPPSR